MECLTKTIQSELEIIQKNLVTAYWVQIYMTYMSHGYIDLDFK